MVGDSQGAYRPQTGSVAAEVIPPPPRPYGDVGETSKHDYNTAASDKPTAYSLGVRKVATNEGEKTRSDTHADWKGGPIGEAGAAAVGRAVSMSIARRIAGSGCGIHLSSRNGWLSMDLSGKHRD